MKNKKINKNKIKIKNKINIKNRDRALFEAGIKLGALYHQFTGTPVSIETIESLQKAIEESIALQPYVESIKVKIAEKLVEQKLNKFGYCELNGEMIEVEVTVKYGNARVKARLSYDKKLAYPLMQIIDIKN
ncbi:MAG: dihydroneopterin aldolase family protein [Halobacteria archaeon]